MGRGLASLGLQALAEPSTEQELSLNGLQTAGQTAWPVFRSSSACFTKLVELSHEKHLNVELRDIEVSCMFLYLLKKSEAHCTDRPRPGGRPGVRRRRHGGLSLWPVVVFLGHHHLSRRFPQELNDLKGQIQDVEGKYMQGLKAMKVPASGVWARDTNPA